LITAEKPSVLAARVVAEGLSVRETERLAAAAKIDTKPAKQVQKPEKDADTKALEGDLSAALKMRVSIAHEAGTEGGVLSVRYANLDQLDQLCRLLSGDH
jgi:ParB family chromosome partitioning protein